MNCMSCLGVVVRLNSFRGFNLTHRVIVVERGRKKWKEVSGGRDESVE